MHAKLKKMLKNEKGMTLVELLAVIVILGIIAAIAIPSIGGIINKTKHDADKSNALMIINAAKIAIAGQDSEILTQVNEGSSTAKKVTLDMLNQAGYLDTIPNDPHNKGQNYLGGSSYVMIQHTSDGKYFYTIKLFSSDGKAVLNEISEDNLNKGNTN